MDIVFLHQPVNASPRGAELRMEEMKQAVKAHGGIFLVSRDEGAEQDRIGLLPFTNNLGLTSIVSAPGNVKTAA